MSSNSISNSCLAIAFTILSLIKELLALYLKYGGLQVITSILSASKYLLTFLILSLINFILSSNLFSLTLSIAISNIDFCNSIP